MKKKIITFVCAAGLLVSCSSDNTQDPISNGNPTESGTSTWSIPISEVFDGGPGKDGIPALVDPNFSTVQNTNYLLDNDFVIGFKQGDEIKAYPHVILDWHEIVNDKIGNCIHCGGEMFKEDGIWWHHTQEEIPIDERGTKHHGI